MSTCHHVLQNILVVPNEHHPSMKKKNLPSDFQHPKKHNQVRTVFDSYAQFNSVSLNDVLLSGPDLTNSLLRILMRFRNENIGIMADIQQMFHCYQVKEDHRNDFFWYEDKTLERIWWITECTSTSLVTAHRLLSPLMA